MPPGSTTKPSLKHCIRVLRSIMLLHTMSSWASMSGDVNSLSFENTSGITPIVRAPPALAALATAPIMDAALPPKENDESQKHHEKASSAHNNARAQKSGMKFRTLSGKPDTRVIPRDAISKPHAVASAKFSAPAESFEEQKTHTDDSLRTRLD